MLSNLSNISGFLSPFSDLSLSLPANSTRARADTLRQSRIEKANQNISLTKYRRQVHLCEPVNAG